jgi:hypothetical protein
MSCWEGFCLDWGEHLVEVEVGMGFHLLMRGSKGKVR